MRTGVVFVLFIALMSAGCSKKDDIPEPVPIVKDAKGVVEISYTLGRREGPASNQIAIWIEDSKGKYIRSVFATSFTAKGGYLLRPDALPLWIEKSDWKNASVDEVDAVSGATQSAGDRSVIWDCKDSIGSPVKQGYYKYVIEGNVFWGARVVYTGLIHLGTVSAQSFAVPEYISTTADDAAVLLKNVTATFTPGQ